MTTMTETTSNRMQTSSPQTYKRLMTASFVIAGIGLGVGTALNVPIIAVAIYIIGMVVGIAVPSFTEYTLFDERDAAIHQRASGITLALFGWLAAIVFPSLVVLSATPHFEWGPVTTTLSFTTVAVYGTYAILSIYVR